MEKTLFIEQWNKAFENEVNRAYKLVYKNYGKDNVKFEIFKLRCKDLWLDGERVFHASGKRIEMAAQLIANIGDALDSRKNFDVNELGTQQHLINSLQAARIIFVCRLLEKVNTHKKAQIIIDKLNDLDTDFEYPSPYTFKVTELDVKENGGIEGAYKQGEKYLTYFVKKSLETLEAA